MPGYEIAHVEDIDEIENFATRVRPVRHHFGINTFGATAWTGHAVGDRIINEHAEDEPQSAEELYVVLSGRARFEISGEPRDAPVGTLIHIPVNMRRTAFAEEPETTILVIGSAPPGEVYKPTGWEVAASVLPLFESGDYAEGARRSRELLKNDPPYGAVWYNAACFEAMAGEFDEGVEHLRRAVELDPSLAELARGDSDLDALREHPAFNDIVADREPAGDD